MACLLNHSVLTSLAFESFPNQGKYIVGVHLSLAGSVLGVTPWPSVQSEGDDPGCSRLQHCSTAAAPLTALFLVRSPYCSPCSH